MGDRHDTVGTIDIGTNPSEPTSGCRLGNRENLSETTTPLHQGPRDTEIKSTKGITYFIRL